MDLTSPPSRAGRLSLCAAPPRGTELISLPPTNFAPSKKLYLYLYHRYTTIPDHRDNAANSPPYDGNIHNGSHKAHTQTRRQHLRVPSEPVLQLTKRVDLYEYRYAKTPMCRHAQCSFRLRGTLQLSDHRDTSTFTRACTRTSAERQRAKERRGLHSSCFTARGWGMVVRERKLRSLTVPFFSSPRFRLGGLTSLPVRDYLRSTRTDNHLIGLAWSWEPTALATRCIRVHATSPHSTRVTRRFN
jgi:hypothetical protein